MCAWKIGAPRVSVSGGTWRAICGSRKEPSGREQMQEPDKHPSRPASPDLALIFAFFYFLFFFCLFFSHTCPHVDFTSGSKSGKLIGHSGSRLLDSSPMHPFVGHKCRPPCASRPWDRSDPTALGREPRDQRSQSSRGSTVRGCKLRRRAFGVPRPTVRSPSSS